MPRFFNAVVSCPLSRSEMPPTPEELHDQMVLGLWDHAGRDLERFVSVLYEVSDQWPPSQRAAFLLNTGVTFHPMGRNDIALRAASSALEIYTEFDDAPGRARAFINLGIYNDALQRFDESRVSFEASLKLNRKIGDALIESQCYVGLGRLCNSIHAFDEAIAHFERALPLKVQLGDAPGAVSCLVGLGLARHWSGDLSAAIAAFDQVLGYPLPGPEARITAIMNKAVSFLASGRLREALDHQQDAYELATKANDGSLIGATLNNLGITYGYMGDYRQALQHVRKALGYPISLEDRASCYQNIGNAYFNLSELTLAAENLRRALELKTELQERQGMALCNMNLGNVYGSTGDIERALQHHRDALDLSERCEAPYIAVQCHLNLGVTCLRLERPDEASAEYQAALTLAEELDSIALRVQCHVNIAALAYGHGDSESAYIHCLKALELSKAASEALVEDSNRLSVASKIAPVFDTLIPVSLELKGPAEAWRALEQSKARALTDLLRTSTIKPSVSIPAELLDREATLLRSLRALQLGDLGRSQAKPRPGYVKGLLSKLAQLYDDIRRIDPEYASLRDYTISTTSDVTRLLSKHEGSVLVEYAFLPSCVMIFVFQANGELQVEIVPVRREALESSIVQYHRSLCSPAGTSKKKAERAQLCTELSRLLLEPVSEYLLSATLLVCVPTRSMHYLPIQSLNLDGAALINHLPVAIAPSATALSFFSREDWEGVGKIATLGIDFEEEAVLIAKMFEATAFIESDATRERFRSCCKENNVVHFTGHGHFDPRDPLSSGLKLHDGVLTAREVLQQHVGARLITLGACESGVNEMTHGDDVIGFVRAFFHAGATSLIASLWRVEDTATMELMEAMYEALRDGESRAEALQKAQQKVMTKHADPYFWAPFMLFGGWS